MCETLDEEGPFMTTEATRLREIEEKVRAGVRLTFDDGLTLEACQDLFMLGSLANLVRERYNGNFGYYNINTHLNPTNVCVYKCDFCAFRADLDEERAYVMTEEQVKERARQRTNAGRPNCTSSGAFIINCRFNITLTWSNG